MDFDERDSDVSSEWMESQIDDDDWVADDEDYDLDEMYIDSIGD
jgi:hypothetical protein